jgi:hypothetical protein
MPMPVLIAYLSASGTWATFRRWFTGTSLLRSSSSTRTSPRRGNAHPRFVRCGRFSRVRATAALGLDFYAQRGEGDRPEHVDRDPRQERALARFVALEGADQQRRR